MQNFKHLSRMCYLCFLLYFFRFLFWFSDLICTCQNTFSLVFQLVIFKLFMCFFCFNFSIYKSFCLCGFAYLFFGFVGSIGSVRRFHISQIVFVQFFLGLFSLFNWITETVWAGVLRRRQAAPMESVRLVFFVAGGADGWLRGWSGMRRRRGREWWEMACSDFFSSVKL